MMNQSNHTSSSNPNRKTPQKKWQKCLKGLGIGLLVLLILLSITPYLIPLSRYEGHQLPFENSAHFETLGSSIHYRTYVPSEDEVKGKILLIHGMGGSTFSYEKNAPALAAEGFYVVAVDLPGFGYSSRRVDENHAQSHRALLLWTLLDFLDSEEVVQNALETKWHLAGHSMGGGTVAAMSDLYQDRVASAIFIDGALFENNRGSGGFIDFPIVQRWAMVLLEHVIIKPARFEGFLTSAYGRPPEDYEIDGYYKPLSTSGTARSAPALINTAKNIEADRLALIDIPALAIWGEKDTWVPLSDTDRIKAFMPQLDIRVIAEAGHCPMETHPEEFNTRLIAWLKHF